MEFYLKFNSFIQKNEFEYVVCNMATILSLPQFVNSAHTRSTVFLTNLISIITADVLAPFVIRTSAAMTLTSLLEFSGLVQERRNSIANALELHLFCTNPLR